MPFKVTERHGVAEDMFLKNSNVFILSFLFFFNMLLDETTFVIIKVLENELVLIWIIIWTCRNICCTFFSFLHLKSIVLLKFDKVFHGFLFYIFKSIISIHKGEHNFCVLLLI